MSGATQPDALAQVVANAEHRNISFVAERYAGRSRLLGRNEGLPFAGVAGGLVDWFKEKHLGGAACWFVQCQSGWDHLGVIDDDDVARSDQRRQIAYLAMVDNRWIDSVEQSRRIAGAHRVFVRLPQ